MAYSTQQEVRSFRYWKSRSEWFRSCQLIWWNYPQFFRNILFGEHHIWFFVYRKRHLAYELYSKVARRNDFDDMSRTTWENKSYSLQWDGHDVACRIHVFVATLSLCRSLGPLSARTFFHVGTYVSHREVRRTFRIWTSNINAQTEDY